MAGLERFIDAQKGTYTHALRELHVGNKQSHWMWFIFPQLTGLGRSETARFYGIADMAEAQAYLAEPVLGPRLAESTDAMLGWAGKHSAAEILGHVDALKFASCMTLFEAAGGGARFGAALDAYYCGERDQETLRILNGGAGRSS